jgi:hypothetical protein
MPVWPSPEWCFDFFLIFALVERKNEKQLNYKYDAAVYPELVEGQTKSSCHASDRLPPVNHYIRISIGEEI